VPTPDFKQFPEDLKRSILEIKKPNLIRQSFSDSFIIATPILKTNDFSSTIFGIYSTFVSISMVVLLSLSEKHAIRGGIGMGPCLNINNKEIYGGALERAYSLESEFADYPRILVDKRIVDFCKLTSDVVPDSYFNYFTNKYSTNILNLIKQDIDNNYFIDYLNTEIKILVDDAITFVNANNLYDKAYKFVCEEVIKYQNDPILNSRYEKVVEYFKCNGFK
jgi:hypothetical protein